MVDQKTPNCDDNDISLDQPKAVKVLSDDHVACKQHRRRRKIAYATLSYGAECPALTCALNMREVINKYNKSDSSGNMKNNIKCDDDDIIDVIIIRVGEAIPESKLPQNVTQRVVNPTKAKGKYQWTHTYSKFWIATWYEYDAVVFLDSDVLLLKPLNELIDLAIEVPGR